MAKVVRLTTAQKRTAQSAVTDYKEDEDAKFLEDLRGFIWKEAGTWDGFAAKAGVANRTVARFASGETKRPTVHTIRCMLRALGYRLTWVRGK